MNEEKNIVLFLVDDDRLYLKALEIEFRQRGNYTIETFATGELCLQRLSYGPDIIFLDYQLDGIDKTVMNGIETLDKIKIYNRDIPVVMLTAQDKIDVAIECIHHLAFDYVVKSETAMVRLQQIINTIFHVKKMEKQLNWYYQRM